jgi:hypothetical protein
MYSEPLAIDLYCGLGGWAEGLLAEGWRVVGFDIERHDYGTGGYPGQLVLQDVLTLHGSQFKNASLIVASPPCQAYSYRTMPWKRAKALPPPDNTLFETCFRIQREASEAAGHHIPLIVENVRGAQKWVGRAKWRFGSYYLWGDVPALMPITLRETKLPVGNGKNAPLWKDREIPSYGHPPKDCLEKLGLSRDADSMKRPGRNFHAFENGLGSSPSFNGASHETRGVKLKDQDGYERTHEAAFGWKAPRTSSRSNSRKAASAMIAKIPFPLAQHIAQVFKHVQ